jgi:hypothetical protein
MDLSDLGLGGQETKETKEHNGPPPSSSSSLSSSSTVTTGTTTKKHARPGDEESKSEDSKDPKRTKTYQPLTQLAKIQGFRFKFAVRGKVIWSYYRPLTVKEVKPCGALGAYSSIYKEEEKQITELGSQFFSSKKYMEKLGTTVSSEEPETKFILPADVIEDVVFDSIYKEDTANPVNALILEHVQFVIRWLIWRARKNDVDLNWPKLESTETSAVEHVHDLEKQMGHRMFSGMSLHALCCIMVIAWRLKIDQLLKITALYIGYEVSREPVTHMVARTLMTDEEHKNAARNFSTYNTILYDKLTEGQKEETKEEKKEVKYQQQIEYDSDNDDDG